MKYPVLILAVILAPLCWLLSRENAILAGIGILGFITWLVAWPISQAKDPKPSLLEILLVSPLLVIFMSLVVGTLLGVLEMKGIGPKYNHLDEMEGMVYLLIPLGVVLSFIAGWVCGIVNLNSRRQQAQRHLQGFPVQPLQ